MAYKKCNCGKGFFDAAGDKQTCPQCEKDEIQAAAPLAGRKWHPGTKCMAIEGNADEVRCPKCGYIHRHEERPITLCHGNKVTGL